jgi:hypothetical protein
MSRLGVENFGAVSEALSERERAREATGHLARFGLERFASIDPVVRAPFHPRHEANRSGVEKAQSIYSCVLTSLVRGTEQSGGDVWHTTKVHCVKAVRLGRTIGLR